MIGYKEMEIQKLRDQSIIVYGCGNFGVKCINLLHKYNIHEFAVTDRNAANMKPFFHKSPVIPLEQFKAELSEKIVILAIENFEEPLQTLWKWGGKNILLFYDNRIFIIEDCMVFGEYNSGKLIEKLRNGNVYCCSENEKIAKDFSYIFDWLDFGNVQSTKVHEILQFKDENTYLILAEPYSKSKDKAFWKKF